jgi:iron(III) transport system substrate-binding protein
MKIAALGSTAIMALLLTSCSTPPSVQAGADGGGAVRTYQEMDALDESTRMNELVAAAEEEGTVHALMRGHEVLPELEKAFEAKYDIDLVIENPGTVEVVYQRISEQARAGRMQTDVVEAYTHELNLTYPQEGLVAEMPGFLSSLALGEDLASTYAVESFSYPFMTWWNTNKVTGENAPRQLSDLTNEVFRDRLVMVTNYHPWYWTVYQYQTEVGGMSPDEFAETMREIASNADSSSSSNPAAQGLASGQYFGTPSGALSAFQRVGGSAPLTAEPTEEAVPIVPVGVGLMSDAPNPAAALLFTQWYLTEGLDLMVEEQFVERHPAETDLEGAEVFRADISDMSVEEMSEWRVVYENLISGREPILPSEVSEGGVRDEGA